MHFFSCHNSVLGRRNRDFVYKDTLRKASGLKREGFKASTCADALKRKR